VREPERQDLRLAEAQRGCAEHANELRAALESRVGHSLDEAARVVVRVIRTVGVAAGRVEFDGQRRQADVILERHEVGAAAERLEILRAPAVVDRS